MIVVDACAVTEFLTSSGVLARRVRERIAAEDDIHAPYLIDTEVASSVIGMGKGTRGGKPKLGKEPRVDAAPPPSGCGYHNGLRRVRLGWQACRT
ncbi:hypothetical protein [Streptomyces sp. NBC_00286]|uniref:hypothetical protein n=1 Tax=Streptomyces sp. NBC_00286 TaxID=2975701 RepID=UPI002E299DBB|nr:hypothetical protein [Streptomyces sp. NBC_00286]